MDNETLSPEWLRRSAIRGFRVLVTRLVEDLDEIVADLGDAETLTVGELIALAR